MWLIRIRQDVYQIGYWVEWNEFKQFEVFDTFEDKLEAMKCCHYLNGGS